jgi:hypothetical protein
MRIVNWFFVVSVALFVFGIGFVVTGARTSRHAAPIQPAVTTPVASVKQIMNGIVSPASTVIFNAVSTTVTAKGVEDVAPRNDEEWAAVGNSAAALAEAGNLLMLDGRAVDRGDWITMSKAMIEAGRLSLKAVESKSTDGLLAAGENVNTSCDNCHRRYQRN